MTTKVRVDIVGSNKTKNAFDTVDRSLGQMRSAFRAVAGVTAAIGLGKFVGDALTAADEINKLSDRLGASTEALSEYKFVAERTGVSMRELTNGWQRMGRRVAEAARGQGAAKDALAELGLEATALKDLELDQQFEIIADALNQVTSETDKTRLAQKLFDSEGVKLLQTMKGGSAAMQELRGRARELGLSMEKDAADGATAALDAWTDLKASGTALGLSLVRELGPALADVTGWLAENIPAAADFAGSAFDQLRAFFASTAAEITGIFASIESGLASVAEFFGADTLAKAFEGAAKQYEEASDRWERVSERFERADITRSQTTAKALESSVNFQSLYNEELATAAAVTKEVATEEKKRRDEETKGNEQRLEAIQRYVDALQTEVDLLGLSRQETIEYELAKLGATQATIDHSLALQEELETYEAIAAVEKENERLLAETSEKKKTSAREVKDEWETTTDSIVSGFADAASSAEDFEDVLGSLKRLFIELAEQQIKTLFQPTPSTAAGNGASGTGLLGFLSGLLPGFQAGGRARGPHIVGERGPEVRFGPEVVSPVLRVAVDVTGGNAFQTPQSQSQFAYELGTQIAHHVSRNG